MPLSNPNSSSNINIATLIYPPSLIKQQAQQQQRAKTFLNSTDSLEYSPVTAMREPIAISSQVLPGMEDMQSPSETLNEYLKIEIGKEKEQEAEERKHHDDEKAIEEKTKETAMELTAEQKILIDKQEKALAGEKEKPQINYDELENDHAGLDVMDEGKNEYLESNNTVNRSNSLEFDEENVQLEDLMNFKLA
jgi:hypothetical protein